MKRRSDFVNLRVKARQGEKNWRMKASRPQQWQQCEDAGVVAPAALRRH